MRFIWHMMLQNRKSVAARHAARVAIAIVWAVGAVPTIGSAQPASPPMGLTPRRTVATVPFERAEGPLVLRLPASARYGAMANVGLSGNDGDAMLYNPASLVNARGMAASVQRYGSAATTGAFGTQQTFGAYTVGVAAQYLAWRTPALRYDFAVQDGATTLSDGGDYRATSAAFTVGVARVVKGLRAGVNARYAEDDVSIDFGNGQSSTTGTLNFDVGVAKPLGPGTLSVVAQHLGTRPEVNGVPGSLPTRVGIGYGGGLFPLWEHFDLGMQTMVMVEGDGFVRPAGGVELGYVPIEGVSIIVRGGLRLPRERDEPLATGGLGFTVDRFSLDYALEPMRGGRPVSHRVGVRLR